MKRWSIRLRAHYQKDNAVGPSWWSRRAQWRLLVGLLNGLTGWAKLLNRLSSEVRCVSIRKK